MQAQEIRAPFAATASAMLRLQQASYWTLNYSSVLSETRSNKYDKRDLKLSDDQQIAARYLCQELNLPRTDVQSCVSKSKTE